MTRINDLEINLEEKVDLSDSINLSLKVSKLWNENFLDLKKWKKNLSLRPKYKIKLEKNNTKNFDALYETKFEKKIDLFSEKKEDFLKTSIATTIFKIKNLENPLKNSTKNQDILAEIELEKIKKENEIFEKLKEEEKKEEIFVENFIEKNTKNGFQVYPLYKPKSKINFFRIAFILASILFVVLLDKIIVESLVKTSYTDLVLIKDNFSDIEKTKKTVSSAWIRLFLAEILFSPFSIIPNQTIENVNHLIDWWQNVTKLLGKSIELYENIDKKVKQEWWPTNLYLTNIFKELKDNYDEINNILVETYLEYSKITDLWDKNLNEKIFSVKSKLNSILIYLDKINKNYDTMLSILWEIQQKKYLVVFQNNDEIRATWGFIWSVAILDMERWKVEKVEKKDVYALEWAINQVYKDKEPAPEWLNKITWTFGLRDANYYPEFKDSAAKIKFFLDKIDLKVDGIIFINQNLILDLIDSVGWVYSKTFWTEITKENFSLVISSLVEAEVFKVWTLGTPKQALFLFAEELYTQLNSEKKYYQYLKIVLEHIEKRDIVFYSFNSVENSFLWKMWLNGQIYFNETLDFNYPVYTSIWWNKSDRFMDYRYEKTVSQADSCSFLINLKIFNTHTYSSENENYVRKILEKYDNLWKKIEDIINIQGKWYNRSYLRILIPKNSEVILGEWQKVSETENYKIIELYTLTKPWETINYSINYILKNNDCKKYTYKFYKQPWIKDYQILFDILWKQTNYNDIKTDFTYRDN